MSGFSQVSAGNIGVDLSSNPTVGEGVLLSTAFSGVGNYVNGYTVGSYTNYYFTKEWFAIERLNQGEATARMTRKIPTK